MVWRFGSVRVDGDDWGGSLIMWSLVAGVAAAAAA